MPWSPMSDVVLDLARSELTNRSVSRAIASKAPARAQNRWLSAFGDAAPMPTMATTEPVLEWPPPIERTTGFFTPTDKLFVLAHLGVPRIELKSWKLDLAVLVRRPQSVRCEDLGRFAPITLRAESDAETCLADVGGIEIERCVRCGGRFKVIASIEEPALIEHILAGAL